jgi:hypothetical protein
MSHHNLIDHDEKPVEYVHVQQLHAAQLRYSHLNMKDKANKAIIKGHAIWDDAEKTWEYKYNDGTSILPEDGALPVVKTSFGYVLLDGHHDVMSSLYLQAEMIPIKVTEDVRDLSIDEFWREAEKRGWSYLYTKNGEKDQPPAAFHDLVDDPNRYFAALVARKFKTDSEGDYTSKGAEYPLWVKVDKDIPFIEFKIANALYNAGFIYQPDRMGAPPANHISEYARKILIAAEIEGLRVVPDRIHYEKIKIHDDYVKIKVPGPDIVLNAKASKINKSEVISHLQQYISEIEKNTNENGSINFSNNFWFFKSSRSINRKANYLLAKQQLNDLQAGRELKDIFDEVTLRKMRHAIIANHHLDEHAEFQDRGLKSQHLNAIVRMSKR